ncbi:unnamed protein product [Cochlearia groenlandica]
MENCSLDLCLSPMTPSFQLPCKDINTPFNRRLCDYDLVEIQIRAIIETANKECEVTASKLLPVRLESPLGFTVKGSVKRFLEKRKKKNKRSKSFAPHTYTSTSSSSSHNF